MRSCLKYVRNTLRFSWGVLFCLAFNHAAYALSLGNLSVLSNADSPFEAKISFQITESEFKTLWPIELSEAQVHVYQKLGINKASGSPELSLSWIKNSAGKPTHILVQSAKPLSSKDGLFQDLVIELKWSSGLIRRVYTILTDQAKEIKVNPGENLSQLTNRLLPEMGGANFDQTLISLYRVNPNAFFAGNIHRLKVGQTLRIPSAAMANSISPSEANRVIENADRSFNQGELDLSTDGAYVPLNEALNSVTKSSEQTQSRDQLKLSSGVADSDDQVEKTKRIEELVAQEKMLADAKKRIEELEKNIADLKKTLQNSSPSASSNSISWNSVVFILGFIVLTIIILFLLVRKSKQETSFDTNSISVSKKIDKQRSEIQVDTQSPSISPSLSAVDSSIQAMPEFAKKLFEGLDLNLDASPLQQKSLGNSISPAEQRVKLNLAKSYLKINDVSTAKLILQEIARLEDRGESEFVHQARQLLSELNR